MSPHNYINPSGTEHYVHTWTTETDAVYPDGSHKNHIVLPATGELQKLTVVNLCTSVVQTVEIVAVRPTTDGKQDISYQFCDDDNTWCDCCNRRETGGNSDDDNTWYKITAQFRLKNGTVNEVCAFYPTTTHYDYTDDEADYGYGSVYGCEDE
jgi:hypothetical protein